MIKTVAGTAKFPEQVMSSVHARDAALHAIDDLEVYLERLAASVAEPSPAHGCTIKDVALLTAAILRGREIQRASPDAFRDFIKVVKLLIPELDLARADAEARCTRPPRPVGPIVHKLDSDPLRGRSVLHLSQLRETPAHFGRKP